MNKCFLAGNLTRDPELRKTNNGTSVANFGLAIRGRTKEDVIFLDVEAWSSGAEFVAKYFKKGDGIVVDGSLRVDTWEDKNGGGKRTKVLVRCDHCAFPPGKGGNKRDEASSEGESSTSSPEVDAPQTEDIPF